MLHDMLQENCPSVQRRPLGPLFPQRIRLPTVFLFWLLLFLWHTFIHSHMKLSQLETIHPLKFVYYSCLRFSLSLALFLVSRYLLCPLRSFLSLALFLVFALFLVSRSRSLCVSRAISFCAYFLNNVLFF